MFCKRPSFWTAIIAVIIYWDSTALNGKWVYDDAGSVIKNVVVNGMVDWKEAFTRDFWGIEMKEEQSHKSFRPITTLTLKVNYVLGEKLKQPDDKYPPTYYFHVVNVVLHGVVTGLITEATAFIFSDVVLQCIVGFIFGLHPVHAEVVSNITSRGELLMSMFMLTAFLSYASTIRNSDRKGMVSYFLGVYIFPWLGMTLSLFSKEQGATTLISVVLWDFLTHHGNVLNLLHELKSKNSKAWKFVGRTIILAVQTVAICFWRYLLNGETSPDFIEAQNPAGFAKDRFTRAFSVSWIYCLYVRDALWPYYLSPDWSGVSIDLINSLADPRAVLVVCLWYFAGTSLWSMVVGVDKNGAIDSTTSQKINMAMWPFCFSPFLLSSNILVVVGLMKADRVIYLPLFGFCILEALLLSKLLKGAVSMGTAVQTRREQEFWGAYFFLIFQMVVFCGLSHRRNLAWSDALRLWEEAYFVNPRSHHTMYNYGYELSLKLRYEEAEHVLRPIGDPHVEGPSNTFIYAMVLFNLDRCEEANEILDEAFTVVEEKRRAGGVRNTEASLRRTESNLLVARAHCAQDMQLRGNIMYEAVQKDQSNEYAVQLATQLMEKIQHMEEMKQQYGLN
jgi:hypothetical protein